MIPDFRKPDRENVYGPSPAENKSGYFQRFQRPFIRKALLKITIQDIIDRANIGRSTFYAHFQAKDSLLKEMCGELFDHIIEGVMHDNMPSDTHTAPGVPDPVFCHLLQHIAANTNHLRDLLTSESSDIFLRFFKASLIRLIASYLLKDRTASSPVPEEFLLNHISGSFVEWCSGGSEGI